MSKKKADEFICYIKETYRLEGWQFANQEESDKVDPFPSELKPPIVLIERAEKKVPRKRRTEDGRYGYRVS